jgi:hypothetical protein
MDKFNLFNEIIASNHDREFSNRELEEINWNANILSITYEELVAVLKDNFNANKISSREDAKTILYSFCKDKVVKMLENDRNFMEANLTDEEAFAASYFGAL